jgi:hypothetical protein
MLMYTYEYIHIDMNFLICTCTNQKIHVCILCAYSYMYTYIQTCRRICICIKMHILIYIPPIVITDAPVFLFKLLPNSPLEIASLITFDNDEIMVTYTNYCHKILILYVFIQTSQNSILKNLIILVYLRIFKFEIFEFKFKFKFLLSSIYFIVILDKYKKYQRLITFPS